MARVWARVVCWGLLLFACLQPAHAEKPVHITTAEVLAVPGRGYSAPPYRTDSALLQGDWETVTLPHALTRALLRPAESAQPGGPPTVVTWYRLQLPTKNTADESTYLYIPRWKTDGQIAIYGDQRLLYQSHANMLWNGSNIPLWIPLERTAGAATPRTILLRIERPHDAGGGVSSIWVGTEKGLSWRYRLRYLLQVQLPFMSSTAFAAVGLFSLLVWFRLRSQIVFLLFFCMSAASFVRTLHFHTGESKLPVSDEWFTWLTVNSLYWMLVTTHFFFNELHHRPLRWLNGVVIGTAIAIGIVTLPVFAPVLDAYALSPLAYIIVLTLGTSVAIAGVYQSRRAWSREGLLLSAWAWTGLLMGVHDWLLQNNHVSIESVYLGPYSNIGAFLIFVHIIFSRYLAANERVLQVNASLQARLQERENELLKSHERLREIAHRQTLSNERQRLMQDMHDGMGSSLLTALLAVENGRIDGAMVAEILKGCIDDLKLTIDSMEPMQSDLLLLLATLRFRLGPRLEGAGIKLRWEVQSVPPLTWLDPRNALHILRILQEAFTNIIKHTNATEIAVATDCNQDQVLVSVTDNGRGFSVAEGLGSKGRGLGNQIRRAGSIGAEIRWRSDDTGTCMTLRLPLHGSGRAKHAGIGPSAVGEAASENPRLVDSTYYAE